MLFMPVPLPEAVLPALALAALCTPRPGPLHRVSAPLRRAAGVRWPQAAAQLFRIRLVCVLLEACGKYFDRGTAKARLDRFLIIFQHFALSRSPLPLVSPSAPHHHLRCGKQDTEGLSHVEPGTFQGAPLSGTLLILSLCHPEDNAGSVVVCDARRRRLRAELCHGASVFALISGACFSARARGVLRRPPSRLHPPPQCPPSPSHPASALFPISSPGSQSVQPCGWPAIATLQRPASTAQPRSLYPTINLDGVASVCF